MYHLVCFVKLKKKCQYNEFLEFIFLPSWSFRSGITGLALKLNWMGPKLELFGKLNLKHFGTKFAPPESRLIEYYRVSSYLVMAIPCKTKLLFVAAAFKIKTFIIHLLGFNFSICVDQRIFLKTPFKIRYNF